MLVELRVRDLGVIRDLTLELGPGMTALTGETGAGKTLLVEALQLVLGGRASPGLVRAGSAEALVEARFDPAGPARAPSGPLAVPEQPSLLDDPAPAAGPGAAAPVGERILSRAVAAAGRSRAWVDGRMAPIGTLAEAGTSLVDIHGQHDQQSLLGPAAQRRALDEFAGVDLDPLAEARRRLAALDRRLAEVGGDRQSRARQADILRHQADEIERASLADLDEDAGLAAEEARLADLGAHREAAAAALAALEGLDGADVPGAVGLVGQAVAGFGDRDAFGEWGSRLRAAMVEVDDVAGEMRRAVDTWEDDPQRLADVQERRRLLAELRRKYGPTLADVVGFGDHARRSLNDLEDEASEAAALEAGRPALAEAVTAAEATVRGARQAAAPPLAAAVTDRLRSLAMPDAVFEVAVGDEGAGDLVTFQLGANRGEPVQPLARVASGGELARTMLALRLVVEGGAPTVLFDEVDAGVGGAAALALARALAKLAVSRQVLVVTHLPQVAAFADVQVAVRKAVDADGRTVTAGERLDSDGRVVELSRMLSGHPDSPTAHAHAEELLAAAADARSGATPTDREHAGTRRRLASSTTSRARNE